MREEEGKFSSGLKLASAERHVNVRTCIAASPTGLDMRFVGQRDGEDQDPNNVQAPPRSGDEAQTKRLRWSMAVSRGGCWKRQGPGQVCSGAHPHRCDPGQLCHRSVTHKVAPF